MTSQSVSLVREEPTDIGFLGRSTPNHFNNECPPFFSHAVAAGFPSPADDYIEQTLDLNQYLVTQPAATYFVRVRGDSMIGAGILDNDILIVNRSITPRHGHIVIAVLNGELTVKRLRRQNETYYLDPENPHYTSLKITKEMDFSIWGVVAHAIHSY